MSDATQDKTRISASRALRESGMTLEECCDCECVACCSHLCIVEPDGTCEHGNPSVLLAMGMI